MAEHLAFGQAAAQHRMHGLHMQQALAGEGALTEHILVNLGAGRAVRINPAAPGKQHVEQRGFGRAIHP